jgi:cytoskeleton protein RodZ
MMRARDRGMSLLQRIRTPFADSADEGPPPPRNRPHAVGALLRERREELGLDLEAIGGTLRIRPAFLAALEQGRAHELPGPTYAIGFIRAYAYHLGFDADRVLDRYKAETAEVQARPDLTLPVPLGARSLPGGPILLVALILALCGYGTWYYLSTGERSRPERIAAVPAELRQPTRPGTAASSPLGAPPAPVSSTTAASPRLSAGLGLPSDPPVGGTASSAPSPGFVASPAAAALPPPAPPPPAAAAAASSDAGGAAGAGHIDIRAVADCWIQVRSGDQAIVFSRVLKAGETYHVPRAGLFLRTGNAGALTVAVDGKPAPALGGIGMLRRSIALDPEALLAGTAVRG